MAISYPEILDYRFPETRQSYAPRDCMLYALGTGYGADPLDEELLRFVYEKRLQAAPTMASVLGEDTSWSTDPALGLTQSGLLHGEEHLTLHAPIPTSGEILTRTRMSEVFDLGAGRGALLVMDRRVETTEGLLLAEIRRIEFARADGGFGGPARGAGRVETPALRGMPDRPADHVLEMAVDPMIPLIYRLSGDYVPIHVDPAAARAAGFERPILHGLATYGFCCNAVLRACAGFDPTRLRRFGLRFSAPVYGGDRLEVRIWREEREIRFLAAAPARDAIVVQGGYAVVSED